MQRKIYFNGKNLNPKDYLTCNITQDNIFIKEKETFIQN